MLEDPEVELVYVATPHSHHYQYAKMCLEHGKHVLVEKAFTVSAAQAKELVALSEEKHLLLAEAIWTRYMPSRKMLDEVVESGVIGQVTSLTANLGYPLAQLDREGVTYGDQGFIKVHNINNCEKIQVFNLDREMTAEYIVPEQING